MTSDSQEFSLGVGRGGVVESLAAICRDLLLNLAMPI